jgi:5'-3' exonuclease
MGNMIDIQAWKNSIIKSIFTFIKANNKITEVVVAFDSPSWRYEVYKDYKKHRKLEREKTDIDFQMIFKEMDSLISDMKMYLPFKTLKIKRCEGDDIISTIVLNRVKQSIIISRDEDFIQLLMYNIKLYDPFKRSYIKHNNPGMFLLEKICIGQRKDGIPNILSNEKETKRFGEKTFKIISNDKKKLEKLIQDNIEGFKRNKKLIDFRDIPKDIVSVILKEYDNYKFPISQYYELFEKYGMETDIVPMEAICYRLLGAAKNDDIDYFE